eukprot:TRINITY_DN2876_c0_g1_i1.p1 TRINITY_DN2876_c0_g1~~TRINITY_DN2876_c0_g1_i1.p1  ORF type:complete len:163 (+),score=47.38 TRINITY_DN2876_c0_g1_i1:87-575(+)
MAATIAAARMSGAGQPLPQEAVLERSKVLMKRLDSQENRYVKDWSARIDLQVRAVDCLDKHCYNKIANVEKDREKFRTRNEIWAGRAEAASQWRKYLAARRFERCQSEVQMHTRRMEDFDNWKNRVFIEAPRQELDRRKEWLAGHMGGSLVQIDNYHKMRLS